MAIDPPSDIVLEVARAADPERAAAVARRLTKLAAPGGDPGADFAAALGQTSPATSAASATVAGALGQTNPGMSAASAAVAAALGQTSPATSAASAAVAGAPDMRARLTNIAHVQSDKARQAQVQFEAVLLNSFVGEMLPKDAPAAYGQGLAGDMWRSMLADQVSRKIASSGSLGIGQRLFATHPMTASSSLGHAGRPSQVGAAPPAQMSANALSASSSADIADGAFLFSGAKRI
jgi:peptidoglycan hydrolase FlgJ